VTGNNGFTPLPSTKPRPLGEGAYYYGIVGAVVRELELRSEAAPASLLVQLLVAAGNTLGRETPAYRVESDYHRSRLFAVLVAPTSRGRKGTSWGRGPAKRIPVYRDSSAPIAKRSELDAWMPDGGG
jgi:hypothetical protein